LPSAFKYKTIYDALRGDIILKKYPEGSTLPTVPELMALYDAGRITVRHALSLLAENGYITIRQGSGSFVLPLPISRTISGPRTRFKTFSIEYDADEKDRTITISSAAADIVPVPDHVAAVFGIDPGTAVHRLQRIWKINGVPYNHMIQYIRRDLVPDISALSEGSLRLYELLEAEYGITGVTGEEHISACNADFVEANLLDIPIGSPLLRSVRTASCEEGPFEYAEFFADPKHTGYKITF